MFKSGTKLQFVIYSVPCRTSAADRKTGPALTELTCSYWAYEHNVTGKIAFHPQQVKHISESFYFPSQGLHHFVNKGRCKAVIVTRALIICAASIAQALSYHMYMAFLS